MGGKRAVMCADCAYVQSPPAGDQILYVIMSKGGGMDGRDHTDLPAVKQASFQKENLNGLDNWSELEIRAVNVEKLKIAALKKLDPIDKLVLGLDQ